MSLAAFLAGFVPSGFGKTQGEVLEVLRDGKVVRKLEIYRDNSRYFLKAGDLGPLYHIQMRWRPMSRSLILSLRGRRARLRVDSDQAQMGNRTAKLSSPVLLRMNQAYIPVDFLSSPEFAGWSGYSAEFDPASRKIEIQKFSNVGALRWISFGNHTAVYLNLNPEMPYTVERRGLHGLQVNIPEGRIDTFSRVSVEDGIVRGLRLEQEPEADPKIARLSVSCDGKSVFWRSREEANPRRLVFYFFADQKAYDEFTPPPAPKLRGSAETKAAKPSVLASPRPKAIPETRKYRIVVDAGHGGRDPGTKGSGRSLEKDINLGVALELARILRESGHFEVRLTRRDDSFIPLSHRSREANRFHADLFISLHCNASSSRRQKGAEIYFVSEKATDPESQRVADVENAVLALEGKSAEQEAAANLLQAMAKTEFINDASELAALIAAEIPRRVDIKNRGVKQAGFYVLRGTEAPAVLVEMGFLTYSGDESRLSSEGFRRKMAQGVYSGVIAFAARHQWFQKSEIQSR